MNDSVVGEAIFGGLMAPAILTKLVVNGLLSREEAVELVDQALLVVERMRLAEKAPPLGVTDHVRSRLEALLAAYSSNPR